MNYLFHTPIPGLWLLGDILAILIMLIVVVFIILRGKHPASALLECFAFVFLYASIFENFAVVQGWYIYGRSYLMLGDVPLSVPLIEAAVLVTTIWLLEKMEIPNWCKPFVVGLFGMLQDFSLDPVATRQVFTTQGIATGRWSWLLEPGAVNIYKIPVYNFPGWMLIMLYATTFLLLGRWWFKRSGYKPMVGYVYPFVSIILALIAMVSPISNFLLWLGPFFTKGSYVEWFMLGFHLIFPSILLAAFWRGRVKYPVTLKGDFPLFAVIVLFHLYDIISAITGGFYDILWLVLLASLVHFGLLGLIWYRSKKSPMLIENDFFYEP